MNNYSEFDKALIATVASGKTMFYQINNASMQQLARPFAAVTRHGDVQDWRLIDRRLQALRKSGVLTYDRKAGWSVKEQ